MKIKRLGLIGFAIFIALVGLKPEIAHAALGDFPWNYNGYAIYYNNGAVGIGTNVPEANVKLQTKGGNDANAKYTHMRLEHVSNRYWNIRTYPYGHSLLGSYGLAIEQPAGSYSGCAGCGGDLLLSPWRNIVMKSSNVGANLKLSVYGTVQAKEVLVTSNAASWPDYVFDDNYNLMSLSDVEKYISEFNHLPNIPDAKEIGSEGLSLGEMQRLHMEKIEELTLYTINQEKEINNLILENSELLERIERLENLFVNVK